MTMRRPRVSLTVSVDFGQYERAQAWIDEGRFPTFRAVLAAALDALAAEVEQGQWPEARVPRA